MSLGTVALNTAIRKPVPLASARKRALVVDDSETILHAICTLLEHHDVVDVAGRRAARRRLMPWSISNRTWF